MEEGSGTWSELEKVKDDLRDRVPIGERLRDQFEARVRFVVTFEGKGFSVGVVLGVENVEALTSTIDVVRGDEDASQPIAAIAN